jgi:hypothetical protein
VNLRNLLILSYVIGASLIAFARPAEAADGPTLEARKHYQEAQKQFDLGNWELSIVEFSKAYELRPDPIFLYNMAQAYRRSGNAKRAIDLYKNYLIKAPKSPQRPEVEERIQDLQKQIEEDDRAAKHTTGPGLAPPPTETSVPAPLPVTPENNPPTETPGTPPPPAEALRAASPAVEPSPSLLESAQAVSPEAGAAANPSASAATVTVEAAPSPSTGSRRLRIAGIVTGAVGVLGLGTGVALSVRTHSLSDSVSNAQRFNPADARAGKLAADLQWVGYGVGAAAMLTGTFLYWKGRPHETSAPSVSLLPMVGPSGAGLATAGAF